MRIGFDVTPLCTSRSGVGTYTNNLLEHLGQLPKTEILLLAHYIAHGMRLDDRSVSSIVDSANRNFRLNKTFWMQAVLPWNLLGLRTDICHFTNGVASFWTPCPTVVTIHDMTLWKFPQYHYHRRLLAMRPFITLAARRAAAIIAVSQATKLDVIRTFGVDESRVHVIHEAPAPQFRPLSSMEILEPVRRRYNLTGRFVLYVGTIEPRKNLVRLLEAFAHLRNADNLRHTLVLVGDRGWKDDAVFAAVERLALDGAVRFLGYVPIDDLVVLYNLADVLVFPSLYEGFGLPVVEAMACGTPVITSPNGSLKEVAGTAAEYVNPMDIESIAEGLRGVLQDQSRREELRSRGLAHVAGFSWDTAARQTLRLYEKTISANGN